MPPTDTGFVVVWMDGERDKTAAEIALQQAHPYFKPMWMNPRYFAGISTGGLKPELVRGVALCTLDRRVHDAYQAAGVAYTDLLPQVPVRAEGAPDRVLIFAPSRDNAWLDAARAVARTRFPGMSLLVKDASEYGSPTTIPCRGVVCSASHERIQRECAAAGLAVVQVPQAGASPPRKPPWTSADLQEKPSGVPVSTLDATLDIPLANLRTVVGLQTSAEFVQQLTDREEEVRQRADVLELLRGRIGALTGMVPPEALSPTTAPITQQTAVEGSTGGPTTPTPGEGDPTEDEQREAAAFCSGSTRQIVERLVYLDDSRFLSLIDAAETNGQHRTTVHQGIARRLRALAQPADDPPVDQSQP